MSVVFLKNLLFGSTRPSPPPERAAPAAERRGSYGAAATSPRYSSSSQTCNAWPAQALDGPDRNAGIEGLANDGDQDDEATDVDLESQQNERLISFRPTIKRSPTGRGFDGDSESSSQLQSNRSKVDARIISDAIIGLSDGLTVPFALTAGLSTLGDVKVVIFGGLAELTAGAISMGLGGYLGAQSEIEFYNATFKETQDLVNASPEQTAALIYHIFAPYHISPQTIEPVMARLQESPQQLQCFIMKFYHNLPPPRANRALTSAITIALGYFMGGFVPLLPYFFVANDEVFLALWWSVLVMAIALFTFGYVKTCIVQGWMGRHNVWSGVWGGGQMVIVGGLAAAAAMGLVKAFE